MCLSVVALCSSLRSWFFCYKTNCARAWEKHKGLLLPRVFLVGRTSRKISEKGRLPLTVSLSSFSSTSSGGRSLQMADGPGGFRRRSSQVRQLLWRTERGVGWTALTQSSSAGSSLVFCTSVLMC